METFCQATKSQECTSARVFQYVTCDRFTKPFNLTAVSNKMEESFLKSLVISYLKDIQKSPSPTLKYFFTFALVNSHEVCDSFLLLIYLLYLSCIINNCAKPNLLNT